ncbi:MAG: histidine phosphatase family protein [Alphaproteobacteria bacterium]|nr:histidine phosphatase family protein [Alphaproteobacteria bacterium]
MSPVTLYVVRHGECAHNVEGRVAAQDDSPLTPRGREQARENGRLLHELAPDLAALDFISSPLHRAATTMELLREAAGLDPLSYRCDRRLMEIDMGDDTWKLPGEIGHLGAQYWDYARPGGESMAMLLARVASFLDGLARDTVLATHAGPARVMRMHVLGLTREQTLDYHPPNAGIMRLSGGSEAYFGE